MGKYIDEEIKSKNEKIKQLETDKLDLQLMLAETIEKQEADKLEIQLMVAEIIEGMEV